MANVATTLVELFKNQFLDYLLTMCREGRDFGADEYEDVCRLIDDIFSTKDN